MALITKLFKKAKVFESIDEWNYLEGYKKPVHSSPYIYQS